jgi:hypothetical protein
MPMLFRWDDLPIIEVPCAQGVLSEQISELT